MNAASTPLSPALLDDRDGEPIPLLALQHAVYCLRQAALIHLERLWAENRFTAEGRVLHIAADKAASRTARGIRRVMALPLASRRLEIAGVADLVEFHAEADGKTPYPVDYKRGKAKLHRADEVQLCAQALCLEEITGRAVPEGALYYAETKRRVIVAFDGRLRPGLLTGNVLLRRAQYLTDDGRKTVLTAWQERKKEERRHLFMEETAPLGLFPYLQAPLLARHLRGDLDAYSPWFWK
jgi:CRISPR-associated exonuclease Cas4